MAPYMVYGGSHFLTRVVLPKAKAIVVAVEDDILGSCYRLEFHPLLVPFKNEDENKIFFWHLVQIRSKINDFYFL